MKKYIKGRRLAIQANIDAEILAGNKAKEQCERTALAEITALENAIVKGEIQQCSEANLNAVLADVMACGSYRDQWNGDYDCRYSPDFECEQCVCVDYRRGIDPRTGNKFKKFRRDFS